MSSWDEGVGSHWQSFYMGAKGWSAGQGWWLAHVAKAPPFCLKGVVVEQKREIVEGKGGKEGEGGRPATNIWLTGHAWPPLNPYFHPPLHLVTLMLTPLTKSTKSKVNSFHVFPKFILFFLFEIFRFYIMQ
jgi:hypothetical protein